MTAQAGRRARALSLAGPGVGKQEAGRKEGWGRA